MSEQLCKHCGKPEGEHVSTYYAGLSFCHDSNRFTPAPPPEPMIPRGQVAVCRTDVNGYLCAHTGVPCEEDYVIDIQESAIAVRAWELVEAGELSYKEGEGYFTDIYRGIPFPDRESAVRLLDPTFAKRFEGATDE